MNEDLKACTDAELPETAVAQQAYCSDCDMPYEDFGVDLVLPDQQWNGLVVGDAILCANCICRRVANGGGVSLAAWIMR